MERKDDAYYIQQVKAGETNCFAYLVDKYSRSVYNLIAKTVGNREDAEELTQDVFLKVYGKLHTFQGNSSFSTWLYRIAYNESISATRKHKPSFTPIDSIQFGEMPEEENNKELTLQRLEQALSELNAEERAVILLFYTEEKSIREIAEITKTSESNTKTKLHRIRKKLEKRIETENRRYKNEE